VDSKILQNVRRLGWCFDRWIGLKGR
jgi:hypothetical protein